MSKYKSKYEIVSVNKIMRLILIQCCVFPKCQLRKFQLTLLNFAFSPRVKQNFNIDSFKYSTIMNEKQWTNYRINLAFYWRKKYKSAKPTNDA